MQLQVREQDWKIQLEAIFNWFASVQSFYNKQLSTTAKQYSESSMLAYVFFIIAFCAQGIGVGYRPEQIKGLLRHSWTCWSWRPKILQV